VDIFPFRSYESGGMVMSRSRNRVAIISAFSLEVSCPHCGEPQPAPDNGSEMWMPSQVVAAQGPRTCVACDEAFVIHAQSRVSVGSP
jgi:hypothetical protein